MFDSLIGSAPRRPPGTGQPEAPLPEGADPSAETPISSEMVELVRGYFEAELKARDGFRTRLIGVLAFSGALLTLTVNTGRQALEQSLGALGHPLFFAVMLVVVALLVCSLARTVRALDVQEQARFSTEQLIEIGYSAEADDALRRRVYRVTAQLVDQEARKNDRLGTELRAAIIPLRTAVILSAVLPLILAVRGFGG